MIAVHRALTAALARAGFAALLALMSLHPAGGALAQPGALNHRDRRALDGAATAVSRLVRGE